jgi:hypothetical protein
MRQTTLTQITLDQSDPEAFEPEALPPAASGSSQMSGSQMTDATDATDPDPDPDSGASNARGPRLISWIWNHGSLVGTSIWQCTLCSVKEEEPKQYKSTCTTHIRKHLSSCHNINDDRQRGKPIHASTNGLASIFNRPTPFQPEPFNKHLVEWILRDRIPLRQVESPAFRKLVATIRPEVVSFLPKSGDTVRSWTMQRFNTAQQEVKQ